MFIRGSTAYEILSDEKKRASYDVCKDYGACSCCAERERKRQRCDVRERGEGDGVGGGESRWGVEREEFGRE